MTSDLGGERDEEPPMGGWDSPLWRGVKEASGSEQWKGGQGYDRFPDWMARKVTAIVKAVNERRRFLQKRSAARKIQAAWKSHRTIRDLSQPAKDPDEAARKIQAAYRCHMRKRKYEALANTAKRIGMMDPSHFLRSVCPEEAPYAEAGAGVHVRLRLLGGTFPPSLVYRVYTHRPVSDVNALCPRDYATERGFLGAGHEYERVENNPWRFLQTGKEALHDGNVGNVTSKELTERYTFKLPNERRAKKQRRRQWRRIKWMAQLYSSSATGNEHDMSDEGDDDGEEASHLARWTTLLDPGAYEDAWLSLATSLGSESLAPTDILAA